MNLDKIKKYTQFNIRISTIGILICYIYLLATDLDIYSPIASIIKYIVPALLMVILVNLIFLVLLINKSKKKDKT